VPVLVIAAALTGLLFLRRRCVIVTVHGVSMRPTLQPGDRVLVWRRLRSRVRCGDIVALRLPRSGALTWQDTERLGDDAHIPEWVVKRVAAVAGDRPPAVSEHSAEATLASVPRGHVYLLGDAGMSMDSRHWGFVRVDELLGVVVARLPTVGR
jgi:signal peptidase I